MLKVAYAYEDALKLPLLRYCALAPRPSKEFGCINLC